ncbi:hypothetical protein ACJMK2_019945 [Sinanodonta woodiana]|uniref:Cytochrome P450 n=1 Tax=Sinanodonta woodiana TaxID=1069815 RepID=A0ABD3U0U4_SINWO
MLVQCIASTTHNKGSLKAPGCQTDARMFDSGYTWELIVLLSLPLLWLYKGTKRKKGVYQPLPGPKGWPLFGNILGIDTNKMPHQCTEWSKEYGPIYQFAVPGKRVAVLTSLHWMQKVFDSNFVRSHTNDRTVNSSRFFYKDRKHIGGADLSEQILHLRMILHRDVHLYLTGKSEFESSFSEVLQRRNNSIQDNNGNTFNPHELIKKNLSNVLYTLLIGKTLPESNPDHGMMWDLCDWLYRLIDPNVDSTLRMFPFLRFLPGKCGHIYRKSIEARDKVFRIIFDEHKATYQHGTIRGLLDVCFKTQMDEKERTGCTWLTDDYIKGLMSDILLAGMTELLKAHRLYLLLMIQHPECQKKAQNEIDTVLGMNAPALEDFDKLPYLQATIMECLRYTSQTPLAIPHKCNTDVVIDGYLIKKDTVIIPNLWGIHHDDNTWGDPWNYRPERFLDENGKLIPEDHSLYKAFIPFSIGPRRCPGEKFSRMRLFLCLTTLLQGFTFLPPEDEQLPSPDPRLYTTRYPMYEPQFECRAIPRQILPTNRHAQSCK